MMDDGKDDWVTAPAASTAAEKDDWVTAPAAKQEAEPNPAFSQETLPKPSIPDDSPIQRIAGEGVKGAVEGFGAPIGQTILSPKAQDWMDAKQREGGVGGFLAGLGSTVAQDIGTVGGVVAGIPSALYRGAQGVVAQTGAELGAPQLGRDIAAIPDAFMGSPEMLQRTPSPRTTAREVQARDNVGIMEAWNRAHAENTAAIADIGKATDIDGAIAAAGKAVEAPASVDLSIGERLEPARAAEELPAEATSEAQPSFYAPEARGQTEPLPATIESPSHTPQTSAEAKAIASAYYQKADEVGGTLLPDFTNKFIDKAESIAPQTEEGRAVAGDTAITGLVDRIQALRDKPISLKGAQEIDERLGDLIDGEFGMRGLSKEGHNLLDLQSTFRDMILDAGPEDTTNGTAGFEALKQGRVAWAQAMKMTDFERILNRAAQTDNPVTSIRTGIRTLLSNPNRARGYTEAEKSALQDAANRGALGSVLHVFGSRLAPLAVGAAGMAGGVIPGLIGAGITHGATSLMRSAATNLQMRRTGNAMEVLGSGVPQPP